MPILFRDFETRSALDLTKVGAWRYATHASTDAWCFAYAVDDGPIELWIRGDPVPPEYLEAAQNPEWLVAAFNDQFERLIEQHIMAPRYGWPQVPIERHRCLQASALALALPAKLANVAHALQLEQRKDNAGRLTMLKLARPRKPRADDDQSGLYWHDDPKDLEKLYAYNKQDVASERAVYQRIGFLPSEEQAHWILDARINDRGIYLDRKLLDAALKIAKAAQREINDELHNITGGELNTINQPKLKQWLATHGCEVTDLQKKTLQKALTRSKLLPDARRAMELRLDGAHAATSKLRTMRDWQAEDGRVRGCFRYHGASPGRFTSLGIQIQNMKRPVVKDLAAAIEAVSTGDLAYLRARFPQPMSVVGDITRALVCARPGYRFIAADYSGIESRVTAWASGQQSKLEQWATFDRTGNPEDEPYFITGHRIFGLAKVLARDPGKTGDLAYGYMGSIGAWRKLAPPGDTSTDDEIQRRKQDWRRAHPQTERFWYALDRAAKTAVRHPGKIVPCRDVAFRFYDCFLRMRLPNGRKIAYPFPRLKTNSRGDSAVVFMDNLQGRWVECRHGQGAYGGTWTENAVQAIARDLFIEAMQRLDAAGYSIVLHAHDEVVAEVPIDFGCAEEFLQIFTALPNWATGLPLAAKVRVGERFCKIPAPGATAEIVGDLPTSVIAADVDDEEDEEDAEEIEDVENVEDTDENEDVESDIARPITQADIDEINAGLAREGIELIDGGSHAGHVVENQGRGVDPDLSYGDAAHPRLCADDPERVAVASEVPGSPADGAEDPTNQEPKLNGQGANAARVYTSQSHGSSGPKQGGLIASWVYTHPNQPKYLKVDKHVVANGERRFYQHHWNGGRWVYGVKGTYAEHKIPYRLPELLTAPPAEPVWVCEGEKDADSLAALGLVATTNPGGAKVFQPELAEHFKGKQIVYIPEDNDDAGREHTRKILAVLTGVAPNIAVVQFPELPEKGDVSDWLEAGGNKKLLLARAEQALKNGAAQETIEPVNLWGQFDPPTLPAGLLPSLIEQFAFEEGDLMGADPSGLAVAALAVCAAAVPDHTLLQVKRHDPNWVEAARLWVGLIGNPSTKKTPIILRVTKPLKRLDAELWRNYLAAKECYDQLSKEERKAVEHPKQCRLRLEDTTIEAAQEVLKDSPDGVLCIQDELSGWFGAMDKYAGRGAAKDRGFWLQSFHGGPYALNRIARGAAMIENLSVSLLGGIQPDPIRKIAEDTLDDGLLQRLIPIVLRRGRAGKDAPTTDIGRCYDELIEQLHERERPDDILQFTDAALAIRAELEQKHLDLQTCEAISAKLAAHIGKYDGLFARLCLLWHCIEGVEGLTVTEHTARRVADFMHRFLLPHAMAFYAGVLALSNDHDRLMNVAGYILAKKLTRVTNRDVQHGNRAMRGLEKHEIESVFEQLEALGWLIRTPGPRWSAPLQWKVNPEVHHRFVKRAARETAERAKEREMLQEMFGAQAKEANQ